MNSASSPQAGGDYHRVGAVIVAAGESRRMGGIDKVFALLSGQPLIVHSVEVFQSCPLIGQIVLVLGRHNVEEGQRLVSARRWHKVTRVCIGGRRRQDSVRGGLSYLSACDWVVVHDVARPCLEGDIILRGLEEARETGAAVAAVPVKDTVKVVGSDRLVMDTPLREGLWAVQTPQVFRRDLLVQAHESVQQDVTDDATMLERLGFKVKVFMGSYDNMKVTTPQDLYIAEAIMEARHKGKSLLPKSP